MSKIYTPAHPGILATAMVALVALGSLAGCGGKGGDGGTPTPGATGEKKEVLPVVNPVSPPPYKTVEIDGVQFRQGRYPQGQYGGTLKRAMIGDDPKTFNRWASSDASSSMIGSYMWSGLVTDDPYTGDVIPDLAESFEVLPDKLTYVTHLRKGLKWSDGKPITAEDVAFTWNTIVAKGYGNSSMRDVCMVNGKTPVCTVVDPLTNKFVTAAPFFPFKRLLSMPIAPKHVFEPIVKAKGGREAFFKHWSAAEIAKDPKSLVTSGPFTVGRFVPAQRVEMVRTDNYYCVDPAGKRLPYLDRMVFSIIPDVNTNLIKFKAKEIDISQLRAKDVPTLLPTQDPLNFKLFNLGQSTGTSFIMFNMNQRNNSKGKPYVDPIKSVWFNDVNFRQAVNHALNRNLMVANYFKGIGYPLFTCETPASAVFNKDLPAFDQDIDYAMKLLEKSGFKKNKDGDLVDSKGNKVEFDMLAPSAGTFYPAIGGMIKDDLKKLGIKVNFALISFNSLIDKVDGSRDWQCVMYGLTGDPMDPNGGANVFHTNGRLHLFDGRTTDENPDAPVTDARPWEKRLDEIFNAGVKEFDPAKRKELYGEYQKIIYDEAPFIYLVSHMDLVGIRNTVKNYDPTMLSQVVDGLHNIDEIYMTQEAAKQPAAKP